MAAQHLHAAPHRRRALVGHVFSGRYKALLVDGSGHGYLKTVCDYVHLKPARAGLLSADERLLSYPWTSLPWYLTAPAHRPAWIRAQRLLGAHGIPQDSPAGRLEFEHRMEARRRAEAQDAEWEPLQHAWCIGSDPFKASMLKQMENKLGENHSGDLKHDSAAARAERIIAQELAHLRWTESDLALRRKGDPAKLALASRLRSETILPMTWIARRLHLGTAKSARPRLRTWRLNDSPTSAPSLESPNLNETEAFNVAYSSLTPRTIPESKPQFVVDRAVPHLCKFS